MLRLWLLSTIIFSCRCLSHYCRRVDVNNRWSGNGRVEPFSFRDPSRCVFGLLCHRKPAEDWQQKWATNAPQFIRFAFLLPRLSPPQHTWSKITHRHFCHQRFKSTKAFFIPGAAPHAWPTLRSGLLIPSRKPPEKHFTQPTTKIKPFSVSVATGYRAWGTGITRASRDYFTPPPRLFHK